MSFSRACFCFFMRTSLTVSLEWVTKHHGDRPLHTTWRQIFKIGLNEPNPYMWELWLLYRGHCCQFIPHMLSNTDQIVHKQPAANGKGSVYFRETVCWLRRASLNGATTHQWLNYCFLGKLRIIKTGTFGFQCILESTKNSGAGTPRYESASINKSGVDWYCTL